MIIQTVNNVNAATILLHNHQTCYDYCVAPNHWFLKSHQVLCDMRWLYFGWDIVIWFSKGKIKTFYQVIIYIEISIWNNSCFVEQQAKVIHTCTQQSLTSKNKWTNAISLTTFFFYIWRHIAYRVAKMKNFLKNI